MENMDTLEHIPLLITISMAAKLCGMSNNTFRRTYLDTRKLTPCSSLWKPDGVGRSYISLPNLALVTGRKFTVADYEAADAQLEKRRAYQRRYAQAHRPPRKPSRRKIPDWVLRQLQERRRFQERG